jgi:hypothetical protein
MSPGWKTARSALAYAHGIFRLYTVIETLVGFIHISNFRAPALGLTAFTTGDHRRSLLDPPYHLSRY